MPIYEYICLDCNTQFETLVLSSEEEVTCTQCDSKRLERAMSPFARAAGSLSAGSSCSSKGGFS